MIRIFTSVVVLSLTANSFAGFALDTDATHEGSHGFSKDALASDIFSLEWNVLPNGAARANSSPEIGALSQPDSSNSATAAFPILSLFENQIGIRAPKLSEISRTASQTPDDDARLFEMLESESFNSIVGWKSILKMGGTDVSSDSYWLLAREGSPQPSDALSKWRPNFWTDDMLPVIKLPSTDERHASDQLLTTGRKREASEHLASRHSRESMQRDRSPPTEYQPKGQPDSFEIPEASGLIIWTLVVACLLAFARR